MPEWRHHTLFYSTIVMMAALFFSRALLSASIMVFVAVSFVHRDILVQLRRFFGSPLLWGMSLLFFLPLVSGLWSEDKVQWAATMRIKLPLLFMPLAFAAPFSFTRRRWNILSYFFILMVLGGTVWSIFHYAGNADAINRGYLSAKSMLTPLGNDHVRFSWLVCISIFSCGWLYYRGGLSAGEKYFVAAIAAWLIIYLHLLAARTGLISLYIGLLVTGIWLIRRYAGKSRGPLFLLICIALPVLAYFTVPTFQNKIRYFRYEWNHFTGGGYLPGSNDGVRIISMKAGWNIMKEHPAWGTGFGDVMRASRDWYAGAYPQMIEADKILPSGEWLMYAAGCGIPGLIVFIIVMCIPFFIRHRHPLHWLLLNMAGAFSFLADIGLEVQFGVFAWSFIVLWWWKQAATENT